MKYKVLVEATEILTVEADNEDEAAEKATDIVRTSSPQWEAFVISSQ